MDLGEASLFEEGYGFGAASAEFAMGDDLATGVEFGDALGEFVELRRHEA